MNTKITIGCPVHNLVEVHPYTFLISMFGCPKCANLFKRPDSINHFQNNRERANSDCELYLVEIDSDYWKIGISSDTDERFRVHIQEILYRRLTTRAVAWCVEQHFLISTEWAKPIILPEKFDDFEGRTEIRNANCMDIIELADLIDSEIEKCEDIGWENYATKKLLSATGYGWNPKDALFVPKI